MTPYFFPGLYLSSRKWCILQYDQLVDVPIFSQPGPINPVAEPFFSPGPGTGHEAFHQVGRTAFQ